MSSRVVRLGGRFLAISLSLTFSLPSPSGVHAEPSRSTLRASQPADTPEQRSRLKSRLLPGEAAIAAAGLEEQEKPEEFGPVKEGPISVQGGQIYHQITSAYPPEKTEILLYQGPGRRLRLSDRLSIADTPSSFLFGLRVENILGRGSLERPFEVTAYEATDSDREVRAAAIKSYRARGGTRELSVRYALRPGPRMVMVPDPKAGGIPASRQFLQTNFTVAPDDLFLVARWFGQPGVEDPKPKMDPRNRFLIKVHPGGSVSKLAPAHFTIVSPKEVEVLSDAWESLRTVGDKLQLTGMGIAVWTNPLEEDEGQEALSEEEIAKRKTASFSAVSDYELAVAVAWDPQQPWFARLIPIHPSAAGLEVQLEQALGERPVGAARSEDQGPMVLLGPDYVVQHRGALFALLPRMPVEWRGRVAVLTDEGTARELERVLVGQEVTELKIFSHPVDAALMLPDGVVQYVGSESDPAWSEFRAVRPSAVLLSSPALNLLVEQLIANVRGIPLQALSSEDKDWALRVSRILSQFK